MLYIRAPECTDLVTKSLYALTNIFLFPPFFCHLATTVLLSISVGLIFLDSAQARSYLVPPSLSDLFYLAKCLQGPSMLLQIVRFLFFLFFFGCNEWHMGSYLVPWPGIEPELPAVEVWSLNRWRTAREVPGFSYFLIVTTIPLYTRTLHTLRLYPFTCQWTLYIVFIPWLLRMKLQWTWEVRITFPEVSFISFG